MENIKIFGLPKWSSIHDRKKIREELWNRIKKSDADLFHFHDPELIWIAIKAKIILNKKIIYDIHEDFSTLMLYKKNFNIMIRYFLFIIYKIVEKIIRNIFDHFILAVEFFKSPNLERSTIIYNYPIHKKLNELQNRDIDILYIGDFTESRGALVMLDVIKKLSKIHNNLKVEIIGNIPYEFKFQVKEYIESLKISHLIKLRGYIDYNIALKYIKKSKIGLCILHPTQNYINSYPTKIFDYMINSVPIIGSNFGYIKKIIKDAKCGLLVDPYNVDEISKQLNLLLINREYSKKLGKNGYQYVNNNYNWNTEEDKLFKLYSKLI